MELLASPIPFVLFAQDQHKTSSVAEDFQTGLDHCRTLAHTPVDCKYNEITLKWESLPTS